MRGKPAVLKRADSRIRLFCRRLTGKQRIVLTSVVSLLFTGSLSVLGCLFRVPFGGTEGRHENRAYPARHVTAGKQQPFIQTSRNMKMDFQKIRERLGLSSDKPLTPEEKRRRARYIVYPFFCLLCAGFLLLVFSPSEKEKAEKEKGKGFNVEMPSPKDSEMEGDKVSAYEQEALAKKEKWRRGTFLEMSELLNKDSQDTAGLTAGKTNTELPPEPETGKSPGSVHSSAEAYRNMNRSLGAVYTRNENQQNADLLRRIEELEKEKRPAEGQPEGQTLEEKMALLEKSYELAARYNGKQPDAPAAVNGRSDRKDRTAVRPVKQVQNQVVSSLAQPMGNEDFIAEFAGERNTGFHTPIGRTLPSGRNTIAACVHGTQTVSDGQVLRIRLLEPMAVDDRLIPQRDGIDRRYTHPGGSGWTSL